VKDERAYLLHAIEVIDALSTQDESKTDHMG
jgi:hypothetical protein